MTQGMISSLGASNEPFALIMGVIAILTSVFFFLLQLNIISIPYDIQDLWFMWFFAGFTFVSGIIHLLTTVGFIGTQ